MEIKDVVEKIISEPQVDYYEQTHFKNRNFYIFNLFKSCIVHRRIIKELAGMKHGNMFS